MEDKKDELLDEEKNVDEINLDGEDSSDSEYEEIESIIVDGDINEGNPDEVRIREINLKIQELEVKMDQFEFEHVDIDNTTDEELKVFVEMKNEYKALLAEKKAIKKNKKKTLSDNSVENISLPVILYGIVIDIFTFPLISYSVYFTFGKWIISSFVKGSMDTTSFFYKLFIWLIIFSLPILLLALTWLIYLIAIKKKINKKIHIGFWIIQGLSTIASIIWLTISIGIFK